MKTRVLTPAAAAHQFRVQSVGMQGVGWLYHNPEEGYRFFLVPRGALALQSGVLLILLVVGVPRLGLLWFAAASLVLNAALAAWAYWRIGQPFSEE